MTNLIALQSGTELVGDYRIERVLGAGGFGITYLADEIALNRAVTIKEYFPSDFAARAGGKEAAPRSENCAGDYRWGLDRFIEEAQTLAKFSHPNIVRVYRYFRANNTGYMVLHFEEGQSLKGWLKSLGRAPRQKELDAIIAPLLDALAEIHRSDFLHRDIAPDNIIIRKDGTPVLIDFGSARGEIAAHSKTVSALVKPGYSPYEQYAETSRQQGAWTDIYALGATLYHAVTGKRPPDSPSRMVKDEIVPARDAALASYRAGFLKAIDQALVLAIDQRPQSVAAWRSALLAPEPAKPGWFQRTSGKASEAKVEPPPAPQPAAATVIPPPPDAPGRQGGMLDFLDGLKKKPEVAKPSPAAPAAKAAAETIIVSPPPSKAAKAASKAAGNKKPEPGRELAPVKPVEKIKAPRPNPIRITSSKSWRPLLFKLLIGVGVASGAVAMQDRLPRFENRAAGVTASQHVPPPEAMPLAEIKAHTGPATSLAYSEDGRFMITAGQDGTLKVWNAANSTPVRTIELDDGPATSLAVFGPRALTGHANGNVVLWDFERADRLGVFKRNDAEVWAVAFLGRPDRFAVASHDWKVALWDAGTSTPARVIDAHENSVQAAAFANSPRGPLLATAGADKVARLWNADTFEQIRRYSGHRDFVTTLAFSPDSKVLASAGLDGNIRLWSTTSRSTLRRFYGHRGKVGGLAFSPAGEMLVSAGEDGKVRVWDLKRGRAARVLAGTFASQRAVAVSPDGLKIAAAGDDGFIRIWANPIQRPVTN